MPTGLAIVHLVGCINKIKISLIDGHYKFTNLNNNLCTEVVKVY